MDRQTVYSGQVPRTLDLLMAEQNTMVGIAKLTEAVFGTATLVDGFTCTPTTPASLNVLLTAGSIYQLENLEASTWSAVAADTSHSIVKQGIMLDAATLGITPPGTTGYSQVYLIEVQYADSDTGSTVLPYYNSANPAAPFSGPGNAGTAQNTVRKGIVAVQVKAGTAAPTGTQTAPSADAGWVGLFTVTVANGASTITSGNIATLSTAPFLATLGKLPQIPSGVQQQTWTYAHDTSATINAVSVTPSPAPSSYTDGMALEIKMANACTGAATVNVNGLGTKSIVKTPNSGALTGGEWAAGDIVRMRYDGTNFQCGFTGKSSLSSNASYYVNASTGSDTLYDGTSATVSGTRGPFATIQKAMNIAGGFSPGQSQITINVAAGTYAGFTSVGWATPTINIVGAGAGSTTITGSTTNLCYFSGPTSFNLTGFSIGLSGSGRYGVFSTLGSQVTLVSDIKWIGGGTTPTPFQAWSQGYLYVQNATIAASADRFFSSSGAGSELDMLTGTITISTAVTCSSFALAVYLGSIGAGSTTTFVNPSNVTGVRYSAAYNGVINVNGQGTSFFPGNSVGVTGTGGQYSP